MEPQIIKNERGKNIATVVPYKIWERLIDKLEMYEDIKAYDEAMREDKTVSYEEVRRSIYARASQ